MDQTMNKQSEELLLAKEVADMLRIGVSTIYRLMHLDQFPKPIKIGGSARWRRADIEAMLSAEE
ncbi:helix-turn-helix transcriptional regulator [Pseudoruegeria sp. SHC-113]|uniref:helix-turn-helix transcriptional regulator n=1 Tax=Pseudoruegeria sp. SHC-113 TaxID=2855439 RepID=UPI0021BB2E64|nr:helix-turn-helix domain-containing protein [Pseudoruegeria sp. SHC-113]MCT8159997.1 helix-turn-helix domain-containing protein [Pseudoruegeria sp. SHC-113]